MLNTILTNEEKRLEIYTTATKPTIPSKVTPYTPLEDLNLNWSEKELPEGERTRHVHRLHPYLGKFIPQLVEIFLRKYFKPGQTVLDPFCGSGTTLIQANELGINSVGIDISAFNVLLSRVKIIKYNLKLAKKEILDILEKVRVSSKKKSRQLELLGVLSGYAGKSLIKTNNEYLRTWFAPQALQELLTYRRLIDAENYKYKDLLKVILSRSARSARLTTHFDLDFPKNPQTEPYWCYKHGRNCNPTEEAYKFLRRYSIDTFRRLEEFESVRTDAKVTVLHGDSRNLKIPRVDGVVTSPPYVGLIDYHEQHAYSYHLLGLEDNRKHEIGAASNGSSLKAKDLYQEDIGKVFQNITRSMPKGGRLIIVANDNSNLYPKIAEIAGLEVENIVQRHVNRRTGRRSTNFFESVFIWRK